MQRARAGGVSAFPAFPAFPAESAPSLLLRTIRVPQLLLLVQVQQCPAGTRSLPWPHCPLLPQPSWMGVWWLGRLELVWHPQTTPTPGETQLKSAAWCLSCTNRVMCLCILQWKHMIRLQSRLRFSDLGERLQEVGGPNFSNMGTNLMVEV